MIEGLICGKFEPLTNGHIALINFAKERCDILHILLCSNKKYETIPGSLRLKWLEETFKTCKNIRIEYTDVDLPYTSVSSIDVSKLWSDYFKILYPNLSIIFSSEKYGDYVAEFMGIKHTIFDEERKFIPIWASKVKEKPFTYWNYIPNIVKPYFVKKVSINGTESTGKSFLSNRLAIEYNTNFVHECARDIVNHTDTCTYENMYQISEEHAKNICRKTELANKLLFIDTSLDTIKVYSKFLFNKEIIVDKWIEDASKFDLYLFLDKDAPYVQDGTRLSKENRDKLSDKHLEYLQSKNINLHIINGTNWEERYEKTLIIINNLIKTL